MGSADSKQITTVGEGDGTNYNFRGGLDMLSFRSEAEER